MIHLEHVNLDVPDPELARRFYGSALGCLEGPGTHARQVHFNLGPVSQFHMPFAYSTGDFSRPAEPVKAQVWRGTLDLWADDLEALSARLTEFGYTWERAGDGIQVACPWGNTLFLRNASVELLASLHRTGFIPARAPPPSAAPLTTPTPPAPPPSRGVAGLAEVRLLVPRGTAAPLAHFYSHFMCADAETCGPHIGGTIGSTCIVRLRAGADAPEQRMVFEEVETDCSADDALKSATGPEERPVDPGYHVCVYLEEAAWHTALARCEEAGLLYVNARFQSGPPHFASAADTAEALAVAQFRIRDLVDPATGRILVVLEHEVRHPGHVCCPLGRRPPGSSALP